MAVQNRVTPPTTQWRPSASDPAEAAGQPSLLTAVRRGVMNRCPNCGEGRVFAGYLGIVPECEACHAPLGLLRADDAPPYIVIFLVGHLLLPPIFWIEKAYEPPMWLHMAVWLPLFAVLCTLMLRPAKGAVVGWMWSLGFGRQDPSEEGVQHGAAPPAEPGRHDV